MSIFPEDYKKYVLDDIKENSGKRKYVKAGLLERLMTKKLPPIKMHPNPIDEFSMANIGPNYEIVSNYIEQIGRCHKCSESVFAEPIIVEKILPDGYMMANGHHRWLAALRRGEPSVHVQLVNLVHQEDIARMLEKSERNRRVSFDLDEVLFAEEGSLLTEHEPGEDYQKIFTRRLKQGVPELIRKLQEIGYDVWVYTSGYYSSDDIEGLFKEYQTDLDGIINARRRAKSEAAESVKAAMKEKYEISVHVDNGHVLFVNSETHNYDYITLNSTEETWSKEVLSCIGDIK